MIFPQAGTADSALLRYTLLGSPHILAMYDRHTVLLVKRECAHYTL